MAKFRWSTDGGSTWAYVDQALPYTIPGVTDAQAIIVEPIGAGAVALGLSAKTFGAGAAAGTTIGNIGGVPTSVTAVFTPTNGGDAGKVAVSGTGASSKLVVGLTASAIGSIPGVVSAGGVASLPITIGAINPEVYLPNTPVPATAVAMAKLFADYTGPAAKIARLSDGAFLDLAALPATADMSGYAAFAGAGDTQVAEVEKMYDQAYVVNGGAANANDFTAYDRPILRPRNAIRGHQTVSLGIHPNGGSKYNKGFANGSVVTHRNAITRIWVGALGGGGSNSFGLWGLGNTGSYNSDTMSLLYDNSGPAHLYPLSNNYQGFNGPPSSKLAIFTVQGSPSRGVLRINGQEVDVRGGTTDALMTGSFIGRGAHASMTLAAFNWIADITYAAALTDAEMLSIETALAAKFGITMQPFNRCISFEGDSMTDGENESSYLINLQWLLQEDLNDPRLTTPNFAGEGGKIEEMLGSVASTFNAGYKPSYTRQAHHIWAGTNDIAFQGSGSIVGYGTTVWTNFMLPYIQYMTNGARYGSRVIVGTTIPRGWLGSSTDKAQKEAERLAYNQLIRDNAATYGYTVADYGGIAAFVSGPSGGNPNYPNTTYYGAASDVHLKENGYRLCADILTPIAQGMLA